MEARDIFSKPPKANIYISNLLALAGEKKERKVRARLGRVEHAEDQAAAALLDGLGVVEDGTAQVDHVPHGVVRVHDRLRGQPVALGDRQLAALAEAHVAVGHHRVDDGAHHVGIAVAVLVDPEVEAVALALVVRAEGPLEPHRHAWVVQLDHLARVGVQLLKDEARLLGTCHDLVAVHVVEVVLVPHVMLLKLGPEGVAVLLEQPRRAEEIPRELQHLLRRHRRRQHRVAPVARPGGARLRHPLRHRGVVPRPLPRHKPRRPGRRPRPLWLASRVLPPDSSSLSSTICRNFFSTLRIFLPILSALSSPPPPPPPPLAPAAPAARSSLDARARRASCAAGGPGRCACPAAACPAAACPAAACPAAACPASHVSPESTPRVGCSTSASCSPPVGACCIAFSSWPSSVLSTPACHSLGRVRVRVWVRVWVRVRVGVRVWGGLRLKVGLRLRLELRVRVSLKARARARVRFGLGFGLVHSSLRCEPLHLLLAAALRLLLLVDAERGGRGVLVVQRVEDEHHQLALARTLGVHGGGEALLVLDEDVAPSRRKEGLDRLLLPGEDRPVHRRVRALVGRVDVCACAEQRLHRFDMPVGRRHHERRRAVGVPSIHRRTGCKTVAYLVKVAGAAAVYQVVDQLLQCRHLDGVERDGVDAERG
eukprot:scaffold12776_cov63-Phaeocystis_antarctica.AAC.2